MAEEEAKGEQLVTKPSQASRATWDITALPMSLMPHQHTRAPEVQTTGDTTPVQQVEVGITDPYCGPKITYENADRIVAVDNKPYDSVGVVLFNKKNFTLTMTQVSVLEQLGASIEYFQCH